MCSILKTCFLRKYEQLDGSGTLVLAFGNSLLRWRGRRGESSEWEGWDLMTFLEFFFFFKRGEGRNLKWFGILDGYLTQGSQYRTRGYTGLANSTIYFRYRSIPVYRFEITANIYIYIYIYVYKILKWQILYKLIYLFTFQIFTSFCSNYFKLKPSPFHYSIKKK